MKEKVVDSIIYNISKNNTSLDKDKLEEIKYGLLAIYSLLSKTIIISILAFLLGFYKKFVVFLLFYGLLRSVGFGCHAKSNIICWILTTSLLLGFPYVFSIIKINYYLKIILWFICFINFLIFCPADTYKRPIISIKRRIIFKVTILAISVLLLLLIIKFKFNSNIIIAAMLLETFLTNPLGYIVMDQKRFKLNYIFI